MVKYPTLGQIQIGEPDANAEYFSAKRVNSEPIFLNTFLLSPHLPLEELQTGQKFLIHGQKGTGKTATLRYLQDRFGHHGVSEFLIFKKAFIEEIDLQQFAKIPIMVDEEQIKSFKHYHHALKRVFITLLIRLSQKSGPLEEDLDDVEDHDNKTLIQRISNSTFGEVIRLTFDSISTIMGAASADIGKLTNEKLLLDATKLIKRNNDDLLTFLCRRAKRLKCNLRLFIDEIHFAYRSQESLQQDAILVRDCILSIQTLNDRFAEEQIDIAIIAAVRSEYLEHPLISTADVNHTIESVGININWSTYAHTKNHPLFEMLYRRFRPDGPAGLTKEQFFSVYFANIDIETFLSRTWNKPRDIIRFFKCAKELFPERVTLTSSEENAVWRRYAHDAWNEMKSSASPFLPPNALSLLEETLRQNMPQWYEGRPKLTVSSFGDTMRPIFELAKGSNTNFYDFAHFMNLLYILGLFGTRHVSGIGENIFQTYHRGNRSFHAEGEVRIHPTVMKAFG